MKNAHAPSQLQPRRNSLWWKNVGTQSILINHPCNNSLKTNIQMCIWQLWPSKALNLLQTQTTRRQNWIPSAYLQ